MSAYPAKKRAATLYDPADPAPYKISRSKIELFTQCPRCFYLDRRLGIERPQGFPFNLNSAVDLLLKKEFDRHRAAGTPHPFMTQAGIDAVPMRHPQLEAWRTNFTGVRYLHEPTNLLVFGAVDDLWLNAEGEVHVVDYKATSKDAEVTLDAEWQDGYRRQVEVYQWLLRRNGLKVSDLAYFVYCNGLRDRESFDCRLDFKVKVLSHAGDDSWVEGSLARILACLRSDAPPPVHAGCEYCAFAERASSR